MTVQSQTSTQYPTLCHWCCSFCSSLASAGISVDAEEYQPPIWKSYCEMTFCPRMDWDFFNQNLNIPLNYRTCFS
uniref:Uncharacterized protein n=1 Tax=Ficedula albicollis TaxID=59894 RepID=A0A803W7J2_FICAL